MTFEDFKARLSGMSNDELKEMLERRHPDYAEKRKHWDFLEATYEGGREWFKHNIFQYYKEGDTEFRERLDRAYRFNHTREVVDLVNKYIFKAPIVRRKEDAPQAIKNFWKNSTLRRREIQEFMKLVSAKASTFGKIWVVVDSNKRGGGGTTQEDKASGNRVYSYIVKPQNVLDMGYAPDGTLNWIIIDSTARDDSDPWSAGENVQQFRIWTPNYWALFEKVGTGNRKRYQFVDAGEHNVGITPAFPVDHVIDENLYSGQALIDDTAYLDRAVANYLSNLDAIIQDQTFSQLVIPAQAMIPGDDGHEKILEMSTKRIFTFDGQSNMEPKFISPDTSQAGTILKVVEKIISEIYHSTGMAGERTKQDNSMSIDNSSGVAKAYDFERMNAMLASKANALQMAEMQLMQIVSAYNSEEFEADDERPLVKYPDNFDVRGLYDEFEIAQRLSMVGAPKELRREQMKTVADKLFVTTPTKRLSAIKKEIEDEWLEDDEISLQQPPAPSDIPAGENRQGQVTEETP